MAAGDWIEELARCLPAERISTRRSDCEAASRDESSLPPSLPDVVAWPTSTQEVAAIVELAVRSRVEPGFVYERLNEALRPHGLFFPPSPGGSSDSATIGGMVANDASGIYSVKYGGTRDSVLALTVVLGDGRVLRLGSDCRKTSSGYHLVGLVIGAEGTLGLVTEITL